MAVTNLLAGSQSYTQYNELWSVKSTIYDKITDLNSVFALTCNKLL